MDIIAWKEAVRRRLTNTARSLKQLTPGTLYGMLAASSLLPVVVAANGGDFAAIATLTGVVGGVGGNLLANQIQSWKDRSDTELAAELGQLAGEKPEWRDALDALILELETPRVVQAILGEADRDWFQRSLAGELAKLGNLERYQQQLNVTLTGSGGLALGAGALAAGAGGAAIGRDLHGNLTINNLSTDPDRPADDSLHTAYLNRLFERMQALSLGGVDPKAAGDAQASLRLDAVYTALLTEQVEAMGKGGGKGGLLEGQPDGAMGGEMRGEMRGRRLSAVEQTERHRLLVLLGDPGSGKSTFVNFVALCLAGERLGRAEANLALLTAPLLTAPLPDGEDAKKPPPQPSPAAGEEATPQPWSHGALLPVHVVLRDFAAQGLPSAGQPANAGHLWHFIAARLDADSPVPYAPLLRKTLLDKGGLLLLDGLDEVPAAETRRTQIKAAVEDFADTFPLCRLLVTSRTYAYQRQEWQLVGFQPALLAPFTPGQIDGFVERWYRHIGQVRHLSDTDAQGRAAVLRQAIIPTVWMTGRRRWTHRTRLYEWYAAAGGAAMTHP